MTAREYLEQAYHLDQQINSKIEQVESLHALATKATATMNDSPVQQTRNSHSMADVILNIIDLENEINEDIDRLVDLKRDITRTLNLMENAELRTLLEKRYLCMKTWEEIGLEMHFTVRWAHRVHSDALRSLDDILVKKVPKK